MNRSIQTFALALLLLGLSNNFARAELVISANNVSLAPGGTETMDFSVSSTTGTDTLSAFSMTLLITPVGTPAASLQFTASQSDPFGAGNYVFFGQSFDQAQTPPLPFWTLPPGTTNYPNDTLTGSDAANSSPVTIPSTGSQLLGTVQFSLPLGAMPGDQYQISLVPNSTQFYDASGTQITSYSSSPGTVTVSGGVTVPEPGSAVMGLTGAMLSSAYGLLRLRRPSRRPA